jgi:hypothetical protein
LERERLRALSLNTSGQLLVTTTVAESIAIYQRREAFLKSTALQPRAAASKTVNAKK